MPTLHVHLDEAGDLNFSSPSSKYYVVAVTWTYEPYDIAHALSKIRFDFLKKGHNLVRFHATEDIQYVRDAMCECIGRQSSPWKFAAVVVDKSNLNPAFHNPVRFYTDLASMPLRFVFKSPMKPGTKRVLIYSDRPPSQIAQKDLELVNKAIKTAARKTLSSEVTFYSYHHPSASNLWLQIVDYCCWAVFRKWEHDDLDTYRLLSSHLSAPERLVPGPKAASPTAANGK